VGNVWEMCGKCVGNVCVCVGVFEVFVETCCFVVVWLC